MPYNLRKQSKDATLEVQTEKPAQIRNKRASQQKSTSPTKKAKTATSPQKPSITLPPSPTKSPKSPTKPSLVAKSAKSPKHVRPASPKTNASYKRVMKQVQSVVNTTSEPDVNKSASLTVKRQKTIEQGVAVRAQLAKRAVDKQVKSLGAHPIHRVATHHVGKGLTTRITKKPVSIVKKVSNKGEKKIIIKARKVSEKATQHIKKAIISEMKRMGTSKPSEVVAKVGIAHAKATLHAEVVKKALVKELNTRSKH